MDGGSGRRQAAGGGEPGGLRPVPPGQRIEVIDVLRGLAILGIFVVNIRLFAEPPYLHFVDQWPWSGPVDVAADAAISFLAEGKFYTMFSFLFGLGAAIQLQRSLEKGASFTGLFARRMGLLLLIGLAHAFLIWWGDILTAYAVLGFVLLLFRRLEVKRLIRWAGALLLVPVVLYGANYGMVNAALEGPQGAEMREFFAAYEAYIAEQAAASYAAYGSSDLAAIMAQRTHDVFFFWEGAAIMLPVVFALFLLGFAAGKERIFYNLPEYRPLARRVLGWGLALGVPANAVFVLTRDEITTLIPTLPALAGIAAHVVGSAALCLAYIAAVVLLSDVPAWQSRLRPLAAVGRMALTNYLAQSVIATTIFYGFGLGLYGQVAPAAMLAIVAAVFAVQVVYSRWWLARFHYGPVEWLWRCLTYGSRQPLRR